MQLPLITVTTKDVGDREIARLSAIHHGAGSIGGAVAVSHLGLQFDATRLATDDVEGCHRSLDNRGGTSNDGLRPFPINLINQALPRHHRKLRGLALESLGLAVKPTLNKHPQLSVIGRITQQLSLIHI